MDASQHRWFAGILTHLHLAIDDCTGKLTGGYFTVQETLDGYYNVFKQTLEGYGIPFSFLTDNRTIFNYKMAKSKTPDKDVLTQFGYACKTLGCTIESTSISQAKGRIERAFETLQSRLVNEFFLHSIHTLEQANNYLIDVFIPSFNKKFSRDVTNSVFDVAPSPEIINYTLAVLSPRKFDNGNSIRFLNNYYQPFHDGKLVCFKPRTECLVIKAFNGDLLVTVDETVYELRPLPSFSAFSSNFDVLPKNDKKAKKPYIPPMSHPWKAESFRRQMEKAHKKQIFT
jgi:hypothetical protein